MRSISPTPDPSRSSPVRRSRGNSASSASGSGNRASQVWRGHLGFLGVAQARPIGVRVWKLAAARQDPWSSRPGVPRRRSPSSAGTRALRRARSADAPSLRVSPGPRPHSRGPRRISTEGSRREYATNRRSSREVRRGLRRPAGVLTSNPMWHASQLRSDEARDLEELALGEDPDAPDHGVQNVDFEHRIVERVSESSPARSLNSLKINALEEAPELRAAGPRFAFLQGCQGGRS
jgi:hypothetical protein